MPGINFKKIKERILKMNDAWRQLAAGVKFRNISPADFQAKIDAAAASDQRVADLEAQKKAEMNTRSALYRELNDMSVDVREGVEGDSNFGPDSPLYSAMGFIAESLRKSGLTRKKKNGGDK